MPTSQKIWVWFLRLFPLFIPLLLLIPSSHWIAQEIRTFAGLTTVLILPGYGFARLLRLFDSFNNWFEAFSLSVALSWGGGLSLWLLYFFLGVPLNVVSLVWLGLTIITLIASLFVPLPRTLSSRPTSLWFTASLLIWVLIVTGGTYLYGGRLAGDAYSYMTWLQNVRVGDIQPGVNIHASWEANYPFFKNLYAPTLFYYAISSFLARVDTPWIWSHAPTLWVPVMLATHFSLTYRLFKRRAVGVTVVLLLPFLYGGRPLASSLGDSHAISSYILIPMALWLYLHLCFAKGRALWWAFPVATLVAVSMTFEHIQHVLQFLMILGTFAVIHLLPNQRKEVFWRSSFFIAAILLLSAPFIWYTIQLASQYQFDAGRTTTATLETTTRFLGNEQFFIVEPRLLLGHQTLYLLTIFGALWTIRYGRFLWNHQSAKLILICLAMVLLIGFNPVLAPFLSRMIAPHLVHRLGTALITYPILAYGVTRAVMQIRISWRHRRQIATEPVAWLLLFALLVAYQFSLITINGIQRKSINLTYAPSNISPNLTDRMIRQLIDGELESPVYPILNPPARLTRYLDQATLTFIKEDIPSDSVFLSERLTEYNLPAYVDQLTYLGRLGWAEFGEICQDVRGEGADQAFSRIRRPEVHQRLDVACAILNPDAEPTELESIIKVNHAEIDYILVTPNTAYLDEKLAQIMPQARIYGGDGFAIYAITGQE